MTPVMIGFTLYLIMILFVGFYTVRITRDLNDFALGGHKLGPWVIAFSERASGESAWIILGLPGVGLVAGLFELWTAVGCILGIIFSWYVVAQRLRQATSDYSVLTLPEYFAKRFGDPNGIMRILASIIIAFFFTFYVAAQFSGAGKVLNVTFGMTQMQGMILGAIIIVFYTIMGGFFAVAWTDLVQGIIMIGTLVILPIVGLIEYQAFTGHGVSLDASNLYGGQIGWGAIAGVLGGLSWGLGYMGQPHLITRYMAIDDPKNIKISRRIAISWAIPAFFGSLFIGIIGGQLLFSGQMLLQGQEIQSLGHLKELITAGLVDSEKIMPEMASHLLNPWIAGIMISGAIAAMMSTADSQLLVTTTVLTQDVTKRYIKREATSEQLLRYGRYLAISIGLIAFYLAWQSTDLVFELVSYAWGGLGASFGPALVLSLWWKKISRKGIIAGMITGTLFTVVDVFGEWITARLSAFVIAFIAVVVVSLFWPDEKEAPVSQI
ncbi:MAG: sodium/proline symporter [Candidatus Marinimicrobia bacterium]|nr:sodium/proline symporter [Candidatus Neomarinimicrobiota bacterium]MCF7840445.1 sodium/proline symporter [Candidatus Neomarinimicrobiota bacterium]